MDYKQFFAKLRDDQKKAIDNKATEISNNYLKVIKNYIENNREIITSSETIKVPMGKCDTNCRSKLDYLVRKKIESLLPANSSMTLQISEEQDINCSKNPGFLGLYSLDNKSCPCYHTFSYLINLNNS